MPLALDKLSDHLGAEATGIDLRQPLAADDRRALNQAFVDHHVLVIRDQQLGPHEMLAGVQNFGEVFQQHNTRFALEDCPQIHYISNQDRYPDGTRYIPGEGFHTDHSNDACPPKATVLHAVQLPDSGGNTQFVNMHRAYEALPDATKRRVQDLQSVHVYQSRHSARKLMALPDNGTSRAPQSVTHPLVRTHPETGRKSLYINPIRIESIVGMAEDEAQQLLRELLVHATQEDFQYSHTWQVGDLVLWDNRCLLHKANADYDHAQTRYLYRVMLQGDRPH
ncbi:MAG: TauD/TfdA dioxygenase family protein [Hyphomicrobiaceae bacterium]